MAKKSETKKPAKAPKKAPKAAKKPRAKKKTPIADRTKGLSKKQTKGFALARKAATIFQKSRAGGKLTKSDASTLAKLRKYKKSHRRQLSPEQKKRLRGMKRSYTTAKRKRAAMLAWLQRRKKYGKVGRADVSSFKKAAATRKAKGGKAAGKTTKAAKATKTATKKTAKTKSPKATKAAKPKATKATKATTASGKGKGKGKGTKKAAEKKPAKAKKAKK